MKLHSLRRYSTRTAVALVALSAVSVAMLSAGCGGGSSSSVSSPATSRKRAAMVMTIKWPSRSGTRKIPLAANSIVITLTGGGATTTKLIPRPSSGAPSPVNITGLALGSYTVSASAYATTDGTGVVLATASTSIAFTVSNPTQSAVLDLATTITRLVATPSPLVLATSGTQHTVPLSVTGLDSSGDMIPVGTLTYVFKDSGVASVDPTTGIVTGLGVGATTLTVTDSDSGLSATIPVSVAKFATPDWTTTLDGPVRSGSVVAPDGNIFVGGSNGTLFGFLPNGASAFGGAGGLITLTAAPVQVGTPAVDSTNHVYVTADSGEFFELDGSGNQVSYLQDPSIYAVSNGTTDSRIVASVAVAANGTVYIPTNAGTMLIVNTSSPSATEQPITVTPAPSIVTTPVIDTTTGNVFVSSSTLQGPSAAISAFDANGNPLWTKTMDGSIATGVVIGSNHTLYVATGLTTGNSVKVYAYDTAGNLKSGWPVELSNTAIISGNVALGPDNTVYLGTWGGFATTVGSVGGQVFALDPTSGAIKSGWPFQIPYVSGYNTSDVDSSVVVGADGTVYFGSANDFVYAVSPTGLLLWQAALQAEVRSTPAVAGDSVYIGADNNAYLKLN